MAMTTIDLLCDPKLMEKVKKEFAQAREGREQATLPT
jgi:hypothetical protein